MPFRYAIHASTLCAANSMYQQLHLWAAAKFWLCFSSCCRSRVKTYINWVSIMIDLLMLLYMSSDCIKCHCNAGCGCSRTGTVVACQQIHIRAFATLSAASSSISFVEAQHLSIWSTDCCHLATAWILDWTVKCCTKLQHVTDCLLQVHHTECKEWCIACGAVSLPVQISRS